MKLKELYENHSKHTVLSVTGEWPETYDGSFFMNSKQIGSLKGCPKIITKNFEVNGNLLTNLKHGPTKVGGNYLAGDNKLNSLEGLAEKIGGTIDLRFNKLISAKGLPEKINGSLILDNNLIEDLKYMPSHIEECLTLHSNQLTNLKDIHKHIKFIGGYANFYLNPIKSHVVGLLLIEGLTEVYLDNEHVRDIINKHLKAGRDVFECIDELEEAGLSQFAKI